jgi:hypothetical protein
MAAATMGCLERKGAPVGPNVGYGQEVSVGGPGVSAVDVLFVIDDSGSMEQEQANLAVQIPALVRDLASPPDRDGDGHPDWNAVEALRIGITTTDVGTGRVSIEGSHCAAGGDDGALRGGVFEWRAGDDPDAFAARVGSTVESLGITGCAFEQPLEAAARTVARADETGFPADDGLFAVIVVTDEEDCSVADDDAFFGAAEPASYNVHCPRHAATLTPVSELVAAIRGARAEDELVFAAIAGVPRELPRDASPGDVLAHPDMAYREVDTGRSGLRLAPACELFDGRGELTGRADPARRLVEVADLVPGSVLTTICTDDFGPAIDEIGARIGERVPGVCLVREIPSTLGDRVPCEATVTLPPGEACDRFPGYAARGADDETGRAVCALAQVDAEEPSGFFYDPDRDGCPQIVITEDARPPVGAELRVECFFPLHEPRGAQCARDSQCETGYCDRIERVCADLPALPTDSGPATGG